MPLRLPVLCAAVAALALSLSPAALAKSLRGTVGPGFTITLVDEGGATVTQLDPGTHTVTVDDRSAMHNFHLSGSGVNRATDVEFVGTVTWEITVTNGIYVYNCDPHALQMRGSFRVGTPPPPPPPPPPPAPTRAPKLFGFAGPGFTINLTNSAGRKTKTVKAGTYLITVRDRSAIHNFHLVGPGVNKKTGVGFQGRTVWKVRLRKGKVYRYSCDPHRLSMKGSFRAV